MQVHFLRRITRRHRRPRQRMKKAKIVSKAHHTPPPSSAFLAVLLKSTTLPPSRRLPCLRQLPLLLTTLFTLPSPLIQVHRLPHITRGGGSVGWFRWSLDHKKNRNQPLYYIEFQKKKKKKRNQNKVPLRLGNCGIGTSCWIGCHVFRAPPVIPHRINQQVDPSPSPRLRSPPLAVADLTRNHARVGEYHAPLSSHVRLQLMSSAKRRLISWHRFLSPR